MQEETWRQRTAHYLEQLRQGEVRELYQALDPKMAAQLSFYQLSEMAQQLSWLTGDYQGRLKEHVQMLSAGEILVSCDEQYSKLVLAAQFVYDDQGRIKQFGLRPIEEQKAPYTPLRTAAYQEERVKVGIEPQVEGLLTLPSQVEKPPIIILIQGSGQSDMNESVGALPNRPFAELAHGLAERGIATLRFNKRFYQYPPQSAEAVAQITVEQEILADARAAVAQAGSEERVDGQHIFALGHSLGGYLMPRLAAEQQDMRGVIVMNGPWRPIPEIFAEQKRVLVAAAAHLSAAEKETALEEIAEDLAKLADPAEQGVVFGQPKGYWRSLEQDQQQCLAQSQAAVLVLQGEYDFQVEGPRELAYWQAALADRPNSRCRLYPKLSHLMSKAPDKSFDMALYDQPCPLAETVLQDIAEWVWQIVKG